jgi:hypothetical protein
MTTLRQNFSAIDQRETREFGPCRDDQLPHAQLVTVTIRWIDARDANAVPGGRVVQQVQQRA